MSLQSEFEAAGVEYAKRRADQHEAERLAALTLEARRIGNGEAFAAAVETALSSDEPPTSDSSDPTDTTASDLMAAIAADTNKENQ